MIIFTKLKTNTTYELYLKSEFVTICPSSTMTMIINSDIFLFTYDGFKLYITLFILRKLINPLICSQVFSSASALLDEM